MQGDDHSLQQNSYKHFKSTVALQKVVTGAEDEKIWKFYDNGPKDVKVPLICLHGAAGTADSFYKLMITLCPQGYRVISVRIIYRRFEQLICARHNTLHIGIIWSGCRDLSNF